MHLALLLFMLNAWVFLSFLLDELVDWAEHHDAGLNYNNLKLFALSFATAMNLSGCLQMLFLIINNSTKH